MKIFRNHSHYLPDYLEIIWLFLLFIIGQLLAGVLITLLDVIVSTEFINIYGNLISYIASFLPVWVYASGQSSRNNIFSNGFSLDSNHFGYLGIWKCAFVVSAMTIATSFIIEPFGKILPDMPDALKEAMDKLLNGPVWVSFLSVSIAAPFFEEWLCRGLVLRGMLKKVRPVYAITISAAFFAIIHMNPWQAIPAFIMGLVFGYVYYRTGSLKMTMLMHFVNNTMALAISKIPSLKDVDYFSDIMSTWAYICVYIAALAVLISGLILIRTIPLKDTDGPGNCDEVTSGT